MTIYKISRGLQIDFFLRRTFDLELLLSKVIAQSTRAIVKHVQPAAPPAFFVTLPLLSTPQLHQCVRQIPQYVQSTAVELVEFFSGLDFNYNFHDARVDPFEPSRVWVTSVLITKVVGPISCYGAKVRFIIASLFAPSDGRLCTTRFVSVFVVRHGYVADKRGEIHAVIVKKKKKQAEGGGL